jgi:hypothetical protein
MRDQQPVCVLPPVVTAGVGSDAENIEAHVALCGPALLALAGQPARVVVLQRNALLLDASVARGSDATGCIRCGWDG